MDIDIEKLEALASQATQGDWWHRQKQGHQGFVQVDNVPGTSMPYGLELLGDDYTGFGDDAQREHDCAFVAAMNPTVVKELIRRLRLAESKS